MLDCIVKYLAYDLGPKGVRVNAVSAGPVRTLAGTRRGRGGHDEALRNDVAAEPEHRPRRSRQNRRLFSLSDLSAGITGELLHLDGGYNIMGSPGRLLDAAKDMK